MKWRLLVLILPCCLLGDSKVLAVDTQVTIHPDKAFYHPGEVVSLHIEAASGSRVEANILYLSDLVTSVTLPLTGGVGELIWTPPPLAPRGYGVDMRIIAEDGTTLTTSSSAFDVLEGWTQAPRYGFLTQFEPGRNNIAETMDWVSRFHLNGLQFYDWQYRHEALLPPSSSDVYTDLLGRRMSMQTVNALIEAAHTHNIAAMPYTAIYGASKAFYDEHPDWALFQAPGEPYRFGDNFLMIMNPSSGSGWAEHLLAEFARVLDETAFDGIHIDQYGAPKVGLNNQGERVSLDTVFPEFINQAAEVVQARRGDQGAVIFNAVGNWPVDTIAPSNENAVYIEVWQPYRNFMDLHRIVIQAQVLGGGKPVIIAAYIPPDREANVRLANAIILASGAYYLQLGEPGALLADPYFPKFGLMQPELQTAMVRNFDFLVRYENVLSLNTKDATAERAPALSIEGIRTQSLRSRDRVAVIVREGQGFETFSLVNFMGLLGGQWDAPLPGGPIALNDLNVRIQVAKPVARVWAASPDGNDLASQSVPFTSTNETDNTVIELRLPRLDYWNMIVVEYAS